MEALPYFYDGSEIYRRSSTMYLEIGDRTSGDEVIYPDDDICAKSEADGTWMFTHKDGRPY